MDKLSGKLKLVPRAWYAWQMIPGYVGQRNVPYCSPIFVGKVVPKKTGKGILTLDFANVFYAEGVQDFSRDIKILKHSKDYLIADEANGRSKDFATEVPMYSANLLIMSASE